MKGGAHPSPFAALSFPNSKKVPIFCWVDRVFQSPHGAAEPRTHAIRRPLDHGASLFMCVCVVGGHVKNWYFSLKDSEGGGYLRD